MKKSRIHIHNIHEYIHEYIHIRVFMESPNRQLWAQHALTAKIKAFLSQNLFENDELNPTTRHSRCQKISAAILATITLQLS